MTHERTFSKLRGRWPQLSAADHEDVRSGMAASSSRADARQRPGPGASSRTSREASSARDRSSATRNKSLEVMRWD